MVCLCACMYWCFLFCLIRCSFLLTGCQLWHQPRRCVDLLVSLSAHFCWCISEVVSRCRDSSLKNTFVGGWNVGEMTMWTRILCLCLIKLRFCLSDDALAWEKLYSRQASVPNRKDVTHMKTARCDVDASFVFNTALWPWKDRYNLGIQKHSWATWKWKCETLCRHKNHSVNEPVKDWCWKI